MNSRLALPALGLIAVLALAGCKAGDAMPTDRGVDPVVTGPAFTPPGVWGLCDRNPEELRCLPTAD